MFTNAPDRCTIMWRAAAGLRRKTPFKPLVLGGCQAAPGAPPRGGALAGVGRGDGLADPPAGARNKSHAILQPHPGTLPSAPPASSVMALFSLRASSPWSISKTVWGGKLNGGAS